MGGEKDEKSALTPALSHPMGEGEETLAVNCLFAGFAASRGPFMRFSGWVSARISRSHSIFPFLRSKKL